MSTTGGQLTRVKGVLRSVIIKSAIAKFIMKKLVTECIRLFLTTTWHTTLFPKSDITMITEYATISRTFMVGFWDSVESFPPLSYISSSREKFQKVEWFITTKNCEKKLREVFISAIVNNGIYKCNEIVLAYGVKMLRSGEIKSPVRG